MKRRRLRARDVKWRRGAFDELDQRVGMAGRGGVEIAAAALAEHPDEPEVMRIFLYAAKLSVMIPDNLSDTDKDSLRATMAELLPRYLSTVTDPWERRYEQAELLTALARYEEAAQAYLQLAKYKESRRGTVKAILRVDAARCYAAAGQYRRAVELIDQALTVSSVRPERIAFKADCLELMGKANAARELRMKAAEMMAEWYEEGREEIRALLEAADEEDLEEIRAYLEEPSMPRTVEYYYDRLSQRDEGWPFD